MSDYENDLETKSRKKDHTMVRDDKLEGKQSIKNDMYIEKLFENGMRKEGKEEVKYGTGA